VVKGPDVDGTWGGVHVVDPGGKVLGLGDQPESYYARTLVNRYFSTYDIYANNLVIDKIPAPFPMRPGESRPFCYLSDKGQLFFYEYVPELERHGTWVYDLKDNAFTDLKPRRMPRFEHVRGSMAPATVEYLEGQNAAIALIREGWSGAWQQWLYSFKHNTWAPLPLESDSEIGFAAPYGQMVYVAKYRILVNVGSASKGTAVMRPDLSAVKWD
jgi:hypothetical protein